MTNTHTPTANAEANGGSPTNGETREIKRTIPATPGLSLHDGWYILNPGAGSTTHRAGSKTVDHHVSLVSDIPTKVQIVSRTTDDIRYVDIRVTKYDTFTTNICLFGVNAVDLIAMLAEAIRD